MPAVKENTMMCGLDVTENKDLNLKKVIGFVSSTDKACTSYYSTVRILNDVGKTQKALKDIFTKSLEQHKKGSGSYPKNVIIYRDGLSDFQKQIVVGTELPPLKEALKELGLEDVKLAMILV